MESVNSLLRLFQAAKSERSAFEAQWKRIEAVISPVDGDSGSRANIQTYDSTGAHANELLSSGFFSLLTSPTIPWFSLQTNIPYVNDIHEVKMWLAETAEIMANEIQKPQTGFTTAMHELYLEYGAFGNGTMFVTEKQDMSSLSFVTLPIKECYFVENDEGKIDTLIRSYKRTAYQLVKRFGKDKLSEAVLKAAERQDVAEKFEILHFIMPNDASLPKGIHSTSLPFLSIYMEQSEKRIISASGFEEQPFMAARFYKKAADVYGYGPGTSALPELNMLQEIAKTTLRGAQKMVDPPLQMPDQGFLTPPNTAPGRVNYYRSGASESDRIIPLQTGGRPDLGMDLITANQTRVREIFFVDQLQLNMGPQMTATEVIQRTEEKQRLMGPIIGRASAELLSPMIVRAFGLLARAGRIAPPPQELRQYGAKLKITYQSPIFKAQEQVAANNLMRATQVLMPFAGQDPTIMDTFHPQRVSQGVANMFNVDPRWIRTEEEINQLHQQREQAQMLAMQQQQASTFKDTGIGMNNMANAQQTGMENSGMM